MLTHASGNMASGGFHSRGLGEIWVAELEAQEGPGQGHPFGLVRAEAGEGPTPGSGWGMAESTCMRAHSASQPLSGEGPEEVRGKGAWAGERGREGLQVQGNVGTGALSVAPGATHPGPQSPFTKGIPWKSNTHPLPGHLLLKVTACPADVDGGSCRLSGPPTQELPSGERGLRWGGGPGARVGLASPAPRALLSQPQHPLPPGKGRPVAHSPASGVSAGSAQLRTEYLMAAP